MIKNLLKTKIYNLPPVDNTSYEVARVTKFALKVAQNIFGYTAEK